METLQKLAAANVANNNTNTLAAANVANNNNSLGDLVPQNELHRVNQRSLAFLT